jgi:hypothetical protein
MEKNYFSNMMDRTYELINQKYVNWPEEMQAKEQISLVNKMIEYYSEKDDFEKCIVLKQTINRINTEINEF